MAHLLLETGVDALLLEDGTFLLEDLPILPSGGEQPLLYDPEGLTANPAVGWTTNLTGTGHQTIQTVAGVVKDGTGTGTSQAAIDGVTPVEPFEFGVIIAAIGAEASKGCYISYGVPSSKLSNLHYAIMQVGLIRNAGNTATDLSVFFADETHNGQAGATVTGITLAAGDMIQVKPINNGDGTYTIHVYRQAAADYGTNVRTEIGTGFTTLALDATALATPADYGVGVEFDDGTTFGLGRWFGGTYSASTPVSSSDSGSGSDVATLKAVSSTPDSGSDTEATTLTTVNSSSDSGSDSEVSTIKAQLSSSDSGSDTEIAAISIIVTDANGVTTEVTIEVVPITQTDGGSGSDVATLAAILSSSDTNSTTTEIGKISIVVTDSGGDSETSTLVAVLTGTDTGTDSEIASIRLVALDLASDNEVTVQTVQLSSSDSNTVSENAVITLVVVDTGSDTELGIITVPVPGSDSGTGSEANTLTAALSNPDSGSGSEITTGSAVSSSADSGSGSDVAVEKAVIATVDANGVVTETGIIATPVVGTDSGSGSEATTLKAVIAALENAGVSDQAVLKVVATVTDTSQGQDTQVASASIVDIESGTTLEAVLIALLTSDLGNGTDFLSNLAARFSDSDSGTDTELGTISTPSGLQKNSADSGSSSETTVLAIRLNSQDSGTSTETQNTTYLIISIAHESRILSIHKLHESVTRAIDDVDTTIHSIDDLDKPVVRSVNELTPTIWSIDEN